MPSVLSTMVGLLYGKEAQDTFELNQAYYDENERIAVGIEPCWTQTHWDQNLVICTLRKGHSGAHIAHSVVGAIICKWPQ